MIAYVNHVNMFSFFLLRNGLVGRPRIKLLNSQFLNDFQACIEVLEEENVKIPSWICFSSSVDGENAPSGESFKELLGLINRSNRIAAVGINCASAHFILGLIQKFTKVKSFLLYIYMYVYCLIKSDQSSAILSFLCPQLTSKAIIVYPNSGEIYDGFSKTWLVSSFSPQIILFLKKNNPESVLFV